MQEISKFEKEKLLNLLQCSEKDLDILYKKTNEVFDDNALEIFPP